MNFCIRKVFLLILYTFSVVQVNIYAAEMKCDKPTTTDEERLRVKLLCSYDKTAFPRKDKKFGTTVKLSMFIRYFNYMQYSSAGGSMTVKSWMGMKWTDENLRWNKDEYSGIDSIIVQNTEIWEPSLSALYSDSTQDSCSKTRCSIKSDGTVYCVPACSNQGDCDANYRNWPYDIQKCRIYLGSSSHKGYEVRFKLEKTSLERKAKDHNEWKMVSLETENLSGNGNYTCCPDEIYPTIQFTFTLQRHSATYKAFIAAPGFAFGFLNILILWIAPTYSERLFLSIASVIMHETFIQTLIWAIPRDGEDPPTAVLYFRNSFLLAVLLLADIILKRSIIGWRSTPPSWLENLINKLRQNQIGKLILTNNYLLHNSATHDALINEDALNQSEQQATNNSVSNQMIAEKNIWISAVKLLDAIMFAVLTVLYCIMWIGWMPNTSELQFNSKNLILEN